MPTAVERIHDPGPHRNPRFNVVKSQRSRARLVDVAILNKKELLDALTRLGQLAHENHEEIQLLLLGGGVMVLAFDERLATRDLDVVVLSPAAARVRSMAATVAAERGWPEDWLNEAAKGFVVGSSHSAIIFTAPGMEVSRPAIEQLLAMKLCAWRDDVDIADAKRLLRDVPGDYNQVWALVSKYLQPGNELKAKYAFDDLWEETHGSP